MTRRKGEDEKIGDEKEDETEEKKEENFNYILPVRDLPEFECLTRRTNEKMENEDNRSMMRDGRRREEGREERMRR